MRDRLDAGEPLDRDGRHHSAHPGACPRIVVQVDELRLAGVPHGTRGCDQRLRVRTKWRIELHGHDERLVVEQPLQRRGLGTGRSLRRPLALAHEERRGRREVLVDRFADRRDLRGRRAAAPTDDLRAEGARLRGELGEIGRRRVRKDDALSRHAREADVRQCGERPVVALHRRERAQGRVGARPVVRAEYGDGERA